MARNETYSYGQGRVYLGERLPNGEPKNLYWKYAKPLPVNQAR